VLDWLTSPSWWKNFCNDDASMTSKFTASNIATITTRVKNALLNLRTAMDDAGYASVPWTLLAQTYSSPIPRGAGFRYAESGFTRQTVGGCGTWNADANWANDTVVSTLNSTVRNGMNQAIAAGMSNIKLFDAQNALVGHRLCENTDGLLEEQGLASWRSAGAADRTEWVSQIRTTTTLFGPYQLQEDAHPSYWGQLALRNCLRQAYNGGAPRAGACTRTTTGLNAQGEPNMSFG
jgi:hypothetical protein